MLMQPAPVVPPDFGASNGTPISNKETLFNDIDSKLGKSKPPAIEYLFVLPFTRWTSKAAPWLSFAGNYYGQSTSKFKPLN